MFARLGLHPREAISACHQNYWHIEYRMEIIGPRGPFVPFVAEHIESNFVLIDVGCSGGIDPVWNEFGNRLRVAGFDPDLEEIDRLSKLSSSSKIKYEAAFIGVPEDHPIRLRRAGRGVHGRNPWGRLAVYETQKILAEQIAESPNAEKTRLNAWHQTDLTEAPTVFLPEYFNQNRLDDIDFLKLDIDGNDFDVLQSIEDDLARRKVLGVCVEVNFFGSADPTEHTFHNVDRFMKSNGFELFGLTTRPYAMAALPFGYLRNIPGPSRGGRPIQGDAIYLRDVCNSEHATFAAEICNDKLLKLSALFSLCGLPDCAAEVLCTFRSRIAALIDVDRALDLLVSEVGSSSSYSEYVAAFRANDAAFYPTGSIKALADPNEGKGGKKIGLGDTLMSFFLRPPSRL